MGDMQKEMLELAKPLMKWLSDNYDIHAQVSVSLDGCELSLGVMSAFCDDFIKD